MATSRTVVAEPAAAAQMESSTQVKKTPKSKRPATEKQLEVEALKKQKKEEKEAAYEASRLMAARIQSGSALPGVQPTEAAPVRPTNTATPQTPAPIQPAYKQTDDPTFIHNFPQLSNITSSTEMPYTQTHRLQSTFHSPSDTYGHTQPTYTDLNTCVGWQDYETNSASSFMAEQLTDSHQFFLPPQPTPQPQVCSEECSLKWKELEQRIKVLEARACK